ncbi:MAG: S1 RNA-binding domain-containing protein [Muribaculaceae bacterium]
MIKLGRYNSLRVSRFSDYGIYLTDDAPENPAEILLPGRYVTDRMAVGDTLEVFVYKDSEDRPVAVTEHPFIQVGEFAFLQAAQVNKFGAFMDWGLPKNLLCPFSEQKVKMIPGGIYLVYAYFDKESERVVASAKINKFLDNVYPDYQAGQEVKALVIGHTEIGYQVIVNNLHRGMIYDNEIYEPLELEHTVTAYVKNVRDDGKIDLTMTAPGTVGRIVKIGDKILDMLQNGTFTLTDKSSPEDIKDVLHCSKKDFKKAVGHLYKEHLIAIAPTGVINLA